MVRLLLFASLTMPLLHSNGDGFSSPGSPVPSAPHRFQELSRLLHEAGVAYGHHDVRGARTAFQSIVKYCEAQNTAMTRWYSGFAEYGIASTSARLADTSVARVAILAALQSDYWSTDVIRSDEVLQHVVGPSWLDSLMTCYETLRQLSESSWPKQSPVIILPHCSVTDSLPAPSSRGIRPRRLIALDSLTPRLRDSLAIHRPLILALHGGNASYREFALHWRAVADSLNVAVLIPPGCIRYSANDNSWDDTYNVCDGYLTNLLDRYAAQCGYRPETFIAGFSQGANAGIKYGFVHSDRIRGVIAVAGLLDQPLPREVIANSANSGLRIYAMSGEFETSGFLHTMQQAEKDCTAGNLPFKLDVVPGMAHEVPLNLAEQLQNVWPWLEPSGPTSVVSSLHTQQ
jgi:pimeloyl-ACP methyl ester carboxylesterase